jgi:DHA3 family tetracycline resistance protein-like MFS transporter
MVLLAAITARPVRRATEASLRRTIAEVGEGLDFVRRTPWLWATLVSAMFSLLLFVGPVQVLLPFLVKNRLALEADALGLIFAVGGIGSVLAAVAVGQLGLPRLRVTVMYAVWALGVALLAGYGLMTSLWHALVVGFVSAALFEIGAIIWVTLLQQLVPRRLLGRVSSLDWLVSTGLVPVSFALTGPVSELIGPGTTMVAGGLIGSVLMGALLFWPGVRDPDRGLVQPIPEADEATPLAEAG